jgi:hypothetical protein
MKKIAIALIVVAGLQAVTANVCRAEDSRNVDLTLLRESAVIKFLASRYYKAEAAGDWKTCFSMLTKPLQEGLRGAQEMEKMATPSIGALNDLGADEVLNARIVKSRTKEGSIAIVTLYAQKRQTDRFLLHLILIQRAGKWEIAYAAPSKIQAGFDVSLLSHAFTHDE